MNWLPRLNFKLPFGKKSLGSLNGRQSFLSAAQAGKFELRVTNIGPNQSLLYYLNAAPVYTAVNMLAVEVGSVRGYWWNCHCLFHFDDAGLLWGFSSLHPWHVTSLNWV